MAQKPKANKKYKKKAKAKTVKSFATKVPSWMVKGTGKEHKMITSVPQAAHVFDLTNNAGYAVCCTLCAQGNNINQRNGDEITAKYLNLRAKINYNFDAHTDSVETQSLRLLVVGYSQVDGVIPTMDQCLNTDSWAPPANSDDKICALYNPRNAQTYHVFWDKTYTIEYTGPNSRTMAVNIPLDNLKIRYSGTTDGIADLKANGVVVFAYSNWLNTLAHQYGPELHVMARVAFTDD